MRQRHDGDIAILSLEGYITSVGQIDTLQKVLDHLLEEQSPSIVLDCSQLHHLNSTALGVLISAHSTANRKDGRLAISAINEEIEHVFTLTRLSQVFDVYPSVNTALKALQERRSTRPLKKPQPG